MDGNGKGRPADLGEALAAEYEWLRQGEWRGSEAELFREVHDLREPLAALCISGGGIRSATFGLGAIQGMAAKNGTVEPSLLERFDYLSTVSGGGYIGSWLTAWKHRSGGGLGAIVPLLRGGGASRPEDGEVETIKHLRKYSNYLSPRAGALSSDMWTLVATAIRNILLNWAVLIPLMMSILILPRLLLSLLAFPRFAHPEIVDGSAPPPLGCQPGANAPYNCASVLDGISHSVWVMGILVLSVALLSVALFNILRYLPGLGNVEHDRFDYQRAVNAPLVGAVIGFMGFVSLYYLGDRDGVREPLHLVIAPVLLACLVAWLVFIAKYARRLRTDVRHVRLWISLSVVSMAVSAGFVIWLVDNVILVDLHWPAWVTLWSPFFLLGYVLGTVLFVGLSSRVLEDSDREWMSRSMASSLIFGVAWLATFGLVLIVPMWLLRWHEWGHGLVIGVVVITAWITTRGGRAGRGGDGAERRRQSGGSVGLKVAPVVFFALLIVNLSIVTNSVLLLAHRMSGAELQKAGEAGSTEVKMLSWYDHNLVLEQSDPRVIVVVTVVLLAIALVTSLFIDINTFSLHAMYRDRLVRAYLGASRTSETMGKGDAMNLNRFTGFSPGDDIPMSALGRDQKPLPVVNLTLNVVGGSHLEWQQRKAESFTVTPLHVGNSRVGYRPSCLYATQRRGRPHGGHDRVCASGVDAGSSQTGITLGTAIALSGAAASPNMGSFSSPAVGFVMTLFNMRLGAWLGNPGDPHAHKDGLDGKKRKRSSKVGAWQRTSPRFALGPMLMEALNKTTDRSDYVYLSDGGHFDNLGLYEMVRRRCGYIVVLDSSNDPESHFGELGNAIRKIRIDFDIPIEFDGGHLDALKNGRSRYALGTIRYPEADEVSAGEGHVASRIIYIKPVMLGTEPPDVTSYQVSHPTFPHEKTADQMFDESQMESYRLLGLITMEELCDGWDGGSLASLCDCLATRHRVETGEGVTHDA